MPMPVPMLLPVCAVPSSCYTEREWYGYVLLRFVLMLKADMYRGPHRLCILDWATASFIDLLGRPALALGSYYPHPVAGQKPFLEVLPLAASDPRSEGGKFVAEYVLWQCVNAQEQEWRVGACILWPGSH